MINLPIILILIVVIAILLINWVYAVLTIRQWWKNGLKREVVISIILLILTFALFVYTIIYINN